MIYVTHTQPPLTLKWENQQVVLDCESEPETPAKLLYPLKGEEYSVGGARLKFMAIKAHYEARKAEET